MFFFFFLYLPTVAVIAASTNVTLTWLLLPLLRVQKCLDKDPAKRYTCDQLLRHPYFANFNFRLPDSELEEYERLRRLRSRSRVRRIDPFPFIIAFFGGREKAFLYIYIYFPYVRSLVIHSFVFCSFESNMSWRLRTFRWLADVTFTLLINYKLRPDVQAWGTKEKIYIIDWLFSCYVY